MHQNFTEDDYKTLHSLYLTSSMEQSPQEAGSHSASKEISHTPFL